MCLTCLPCRPLDRCYAGRLEEADTRNADAELLLILAKCPTRDGGDMQRAVDFEDLKRAKLLLEHGVEYNADHPKDYWFQWASGHRGVCLQSL